MSAPEARSGAAGDTVPGAGGRIVVVMTSILTGVWQSLAYLRLRRRREPAPRLGLAGTWEGVALATLVVGLVAASMILVDPLIPGLRPKLPGWLIMVSERITDLGFSGVVLWPLGLGIAYVLALMPVLDEMSRRVAASVLARLGFLFLAIAPVGLSVAVVKHLLGRARPYAAAHLRGPNPQLTFDWLGWKSSFASFPSGHSTTAVAAAVAFAALFPRARGVLLVLAVPVVATRIVLGSHYPSDVIAGAAIGCACALLVVKAFAARRVVFAVDPQGRVAPMAGPSARRLGCLVPRFVTPPATRPAVPVEEARP